MNSIKALSPLATLQSNLYLSFSSPAFNDMAGNGMSLAYVSIYDAKPTVSFIPDTTPPRLVSFDLNMNTASLRLIFSETINTHQFEVDQIVLQEFGNSASGTKHTISAASSTSSDYSEDIIINLHANDTDAIKLLDMTVASSDAKTFITFGSDMTKDMSDIELVVVPVADAINTTQVREHRRHVHLRTNIIPGPRLIAAVLLLLI